MAASYEQTIQVAADKPGRTVEVRAGEAVRPPTPGRVYLEVGGRIGEEEWTFLTTAEARDIAEALHRAAGVPDVEAISS